jgi:3-hydroxyacyl-CoA dehydrogenase
LKRQKSRSSRAGALVPHGGARKALLRHAGDGGENGPSPCRVPLGAADWVCEAIIEDLATKRALFGRIEPLRRDGSVVSSNTSGILLRTITDGLPERLRRDIAVTHFFNPVR